jgi:hypothetical protein
MMFDLSQIEIARPAELVRRERHAYEALARHACACADGQLHEDGAERLARLLWASLHGIVALTMLEIYQESKLDDLLHESIETLAAACNCRLDTTFPQEAAARERRAIRTQPMNGAMRHDSTISLTLAE